MNISADIELIRDATVAYAAKSSLYSLSHKSGISYASLTLFVKRPSVTIANTTIEKLLPIVMPGFSYGLFPIATGERTSGEE
ncbi:helix-turn-helix domain-containing protein [Aquibium oceanicum]|uniref:hypothetical protein n=1 Tax=Aquibium oceanicum TaxID=1670800 RepID=UPI0012FF622B|nr:hypothetical protein [Aquibium oceanicum]